MKKISEFRGTHIDVLFTDIDDTLTDHGLLKAHAYEALWRLHEAGVKVVPVTGRPAGWCEMIARFWPVHGVVGENGGFYFRYKERKMHRHFIYDERTQSENRQKLEKVRAEVLREVPGCAIASDQFSRLMDLAVDFCEDVDPLPESAVDQIVRIFERHGAQAKVSSIHVNGWFGTYDKLSMCREFAKRELGLDVTVDNAHCAFSGDSPNDEPMFAFFQNAFAVANIRKFVSRLKHQPAYVTKNEGGLGFVEIADAILKNRRGSTQRKAPDRKAKSSQRISKRKRK
ncbi:MAG: HAD-IIB family hydrolase [Bdellovibrionaceae bacterium]|nr:HAD-IIB family hydrolase [Pseudobdellovibrionaceae bacterium]